MYAVFILEFCKFINCQEIILFFKLDGFSTA